MHILDPQIDGTSGEFAYQALLKKEALGTRLCRSVCALVQRSITTPLSYQVCDRAALKPWWPSCCRTSMSVVPADEDISAAQQDEHWRYWHTGSSSLKTRASVVLGANSGSISTHPVYDPEQKFL